MQIFRVTFHCEKDKFKVEELKDVLKEFSMLKIKTEGIRLGKIEVEEIGDEQPKSK